MINQIKNQIKWIAIKKKNTVAYIYSVTIILSAYTYTYFLSFVCNKSRSLVITNDNIYNLNFSFLIEISMVLKIYNIIHLNVKICYV